MLCNSWIIVSKDTNKPVFETYSEKIKNAINTEKYIVYTAYEWLCLFNSQVSK